jgi:hypothetical protein
MEDSINLIRYATENFLKASKEIYIEVNTDKINITTGNQNQHRMNNTNSLSKLEARSTVVG